MARMNSLWWRTLWRPISSGTCSSSSALVRPISKKHLSVRQYSSALTPTRCTHTQHHPASVCALSANFCFAMDGPCDGEWRGIVAPAEGAVSMHEGERGGWATANILPAAVWLSALEDPSSLGPAQHHPPSRPWPSPRPTCLPTYLPQGPLRTSAGTPTNFELFANPDLRIKACTTGRGQGQAGRLNTTKRVGLERYRRINGLVRKIL